ncbi:MAG: hypothetical protein HXY47_00855 [Nitrospirae bacterium]|nr:hypothetical protein [Nitrospirota bacterium]
MNRLKSLLRNINLLNIILVVIALLIANYVVLPLLDIKIKFNPANPKNIHEIKDEIISDVPSQSPSDYMVIAEHNLFHPQRIIPPEKKEDQPLPKPEFVLYGTLISDDISIAYMEDKKSPRSTPGRGKRQTVLKKGDTMSGYTLKEIDHEHVVMVKGEESLIVKVIDPGIKKDREGSGSTPVTQPQVSPQQKTPTPQRGEQGVTPARKTPYRPQ